MNRKDQAPVHSGNYYTSGAKRVVSKLGKMNIPVPAAALECPPHPGPGTPLATYSRLESALLNCFDSRDYTQAQGLIHFKPPRNEWHLIRLLDVEKSPSELSNDMLCPSLLDAVGAIINACDYDIIRIDAWRREAEAVIATISGSDVVRIEPIQCEPFDSAVRDRVRKTLKGVRNYDYDNVRKRLARLPGFQSCAIEKNARISRAIPDACMFLGFHTNWALAMRSALKQVGITVKQSQAQELAAVFFGASDWHQLTAHDADLGNQMRPVVLTIEEPDGKALRFYHSNEEALFAVGKLVEAQEEPVILDDVRLNVLENTVLCRLVKPRVMETLPPSERVFYPGWVSIGDNEYWTLSGRKNVALEAASRCVLEELDANGPSTQTAENIYGSGDIGLLQSVLSRRFDINPEQIVIVGDHVLAVAYVPEPDGGPLLSSFLQVFSITPQGPSKIDGGDISMYKAEIRVSSSLAGITLEIRADYGHQPPISIAAANLDQIRRLKALTHPTGIFTYEDFEIPDDVGDRSIH